MTNHKKLSPQSAAEINRESRVFTDSMQNLDEVMIGRYGAAVERCRTSGHKTVPFTRKRYYCAECDLIIYKHRL